MSQEIISAIAGFNPVARSIATASALRQARSQQALQRAQTALAQQQTRLLPQTEAIKLKLLESKLQAANQFAPLKSYLQTQLLQQKLKDMQVPAMQKSFQEAEAKAFSKDLQGTQLQAGVGRNLINTLQQARTAYNSLPYGARGPIGGLVALSPVSSAIFPSEDRSNAQLVNSLINEVVVNRLGELKNIGRGSVLVTKILQASKPQLTNDPIAFNKLIDHWMQMAKLLVAKGDFYNNLTERKLTPTTINRLWNNYLSGSDAVDASGKPKEPIPWQRWLQEHEINRAQAGQSPIPPPHLDISDALDLHQRVTRRTPGMAQVPQFQASQLPQFPQVPQFQASQVGVPAESPAAFDQRIRFLSALGGLPAERFEEIKPQLREMGFMR